MKRTIKKAAAFVTFLAMAFQLFIFKAPDIANAAEVPDFEVSDTSVYGYSGSEENVEVPSTEVTGVNKISMWDVGTIKNLVVPEGYTSVYLGAENIEKLVLPSTVTEVSLYGCTSLKEVDMAKSSVVSTSLSIYHAPVLEKLTLNGMTGYVDLSTVNSLKTLDLSKCLLTSAYLTSCEDLEEIVFGQSCKNVSITDLPNLKKADIPVDASYVSLIGVNFDGITMNNNQAGYYIKNGGLYCTEDGYLTLKAVDQTKKSVDVEEGTIVIDYLNLSGAYYSLEKISLPDSVEKLDYWAFYGGSSLKELSIPKNCVTLGAYVFTGLDQIKKITVPESVQYISGSAFFEYDGEIELEKNTDFVFEYEDGIYCREYDSVGEPLWTTLIHYPSEKKSITFLPGIQDIGRGVFSNTALSSLNLPEGLKWVDLDLSYAFNLKSITVPASVTYMNSSMLIYAPALKKLTVSPDNLYYTSYKNCLYDKTMTTILDVPGALERIVIPENVLSLSYYTVVNHYVNTDKEGNYRLVEINVDFPKSLENLSMYSFSNARVYADTPIAEDIQMSNSYYAALAEEYGSEPELLKYTLRDSNKDLLKMIYVVDAVTLKKGEKNYVYAEMPLGLNSVSELTLGNNTECKVKYSSSDKTVAKVNSKTGKITAVDKGTCTINVKCTIDNGKKKNSKTFKIKVKVK